MESIDQKKAAQRLALSVIEEHGTDGEAKADFIEAAVPAFPYVGPGDLVECWNEAVKIDLKTSQPRR